MPDTHWLLNDLDTIRSGGAVEADATLGDYGLGVQRAFSRAGSSLGATLRSLGESRANPDDKRAIAAEYTGKYLQQMFGNMADDFEGRMTPRAAKALNSSFSDPEFWSLLSLGMKAVDMVPEAAAASLAALGAGVIVPSAIATIGASAGVGGVAAMGEILSDIYDQIDTMPEEELMDEPLYKGFIDQGMEPEDARREFGKVFQGSRPQIGAAIGLLTGVFGVSGKAAGLATGAGARMGRGASDGLGKRVAKGAGEAGASEAIDEGSQDYLVQEGATEVGLQDDIDWYQVLNSAATGATVGAVLGGGLSAPGGRRGQSEDEAIMSPDTELDVEGPDGMGDTGGVINPSPTSPGTVIETAPEAIDTGPVTVEEATPSQGSPVTSPITMTDGPVSPEQDLAIRTTSATPAPQVAPEVAVPTMQPPAPVQDMPVQEAPAAPEVSAQPPVEQPVMQPDPAPAPVQEAPVQAVPDPAPVQEAPVQAVPDPALVQETPAPIQEAPAPVQEVPAAPVQPDMVEGRRVLETPSEGPTFTDQMDENIRRMVEPVVKEEPAAPVNKQGKDFVAERAKTNEQAKAIADRFPINDRELFFNTGKMAQKAQARSLILQRAKNIVAAIDEDSVQLPTRLRDSKVAENNYEPEVLLLMEARTLNSITNPTKADFDRFIRRELDVRTGAGREAIKERREEGNAAKKSASETKEGKSTTDLTSTTRDVDSLTDGEVPTDNMDPEAAMAAKQDRESEENTYTEGDGRARPKVKLAEGEGFTTYKAAPTPKVETARKRPKVVTPKVTPKLAPKVAEVKQKVAAKKATKKAAPAPEPRKTLTLTPKVQDVKARVEKARKETNTNPTDAQKESGNYKKGRVSVNGFGLAIENPKGSLRKGDGWVVKMPADYGYIENTRGADGDAVDVYIGPHLDAQYIYVIDQLDANTRQFDEHKVMMGFETEAMARKVYERAFSDRRGGERFGDIRAMTAGEFRAWVAKDPKDRAGISPELAQEAEVIAVDAVIEETLEVAPEVTAPGAVRSLVPDLSGEHPVVNPSITLTAKQAMDTMGIEGLNPVNRAIFGQFRRMFETYIPNVEIHVVDALDMARLGQTSAKNASRGLWLSDITGGKRTDQIFIRDDVYADPAARRHSVMHELTHAAAQWEVRRNKKLAQVISIIQEQVREVAVTLPKAQQQAISYALTRGKPGEFLAETVGNREVQDILAKIPVSKALAEALELDVARPMSHWVALITTIRKALNLGKNTYSTLEAALRMTEFAMTTTEEQYNAQQGKQAVEALTAALEKGTFAPIKKAVSDAIKDVQTRKEFAPTQGSPWWMGVRTLDSISRMSERFFGKENNPVRKIYNLMSQQQRRSAEEMDRGAPIVQNLYNLEQKYKNVPGVNGSLWDNFVSMTMDETNSGVYADRPLSEQKHLSKKGLRDSWARKQHPALAEAYSRMPADLRAARAEAMDFFKQRQNDMTYLLIRNRIVTLFDAPDLDGLAKRIHENATTDADAKLLGDSLDVIKAAGVLSRINGPYFPLMRRGNYVSKGRMTVTPPSNGTAISNNEFEFKSADDAAAFADKQEGRPTTRTVYVDTTTGKTTGTENGNTVKITKDDMNAEARYRVSVQNEFMEMFDSMKEARDHVAVMRQKGFDVDDATPRRFEYYGVQADALSSQMRRMLETLENKSKARGHTDEQTHDLLTTLNEVTLAMSGATRIQSRSLPRRYVAGASKDFTRNTHEYVISAANYTSKLEFKPQIDKALLELDDAVRAKQKDGNAGARQAIQNEVVRRVHTPNPASENKGWNSLVSRILTVSFIDKLASPSYSVINATQPMMISAPFFASKFGPGRAYSAMVKAYSDIGSMRAIREGFAATGSKIRGGAQSVPSDPLSLIRGRLKNSKEIEMLDILRERGTIGDDAGFEVDKLVKADKGIMGRLDRGIGYAEGIARQLPKTIEAINRSVTALAAYRLEMDRSKNHDLAVQFAQDAVDLTQFNYSNANASPFMNNPLMRLPLQFKKYGVGMYQFLGEQAARAYHNAEPGDRAEALKALSYTIGMHVLVAGAMGLPTEPIKLVVLSANALGLTGWDWGDVEDAQREAAAGLLGKDLGEVMSRGLPRAFGLDLSSRLGIDSLMGPFGEPRSNEAQDMKAYMWDFVGGAPMGYVMDVGSGVNALAQGDVMKGMEKMVPVKMFADSIKAYRMATEGAVSSTTGKQLMSPYTFGEAVTKAIGFTPARESEGYERSGMYYRNRDLQATARSDFQRSWTEATGAARGRIWRDVQKWNRTVPKDARLSISDLRGYQRRVKDDMKNTREGIRARKREEHILNRVDNIFGYEP